MRVKVYSRTAPPLAVTGLSSLIAAAARFKTVSENAVGSAGWLCRASQTENEY